MKKCKECGAIFRNQQTAIGTPFVREVIYCPFDGTELRDKE